MFSTEKAIFLCPSDFQLGGIAFKAGLYQVEQLDEGQTHVLIFTMVKAVDDHLVERAWLADPFDDGDDPSPPACDHACRRPGLLKS
jgi:hypothetical protein